MNDVGGLRSRLDARTIVSVLPHPQPPLASNSFIPASDIDEFLDIPSISEELQRVEYVSTDAEAFALEISLLARKTFTILVCIDLAKAIGRLLSEGVTDSDLPIMSGPADSPDTLVSKNGNRRWMSSSSWGVQSRAAFLRKQWLVMSPIFTQLGEHLELDDGCVLPFTAESPEEKETGSSIMYVVRVHPSHLRITSNMDTVSNSCCVRESEGVRESERDAQREMLMSILAQTSAKYMVKCPKSISEFHAERCILNALRDQHNSHIVTLLATFSLANKNYLLFPAAAKDLWQFWMEDTCWGPFPWRHSDLFVWVLEEMCGLAGALRTIHNFKMGGESVFGRHGDVKAANILLYTPTTGSETWTTSRLADMGSSMMLFDEQSRWTIKPAPGTGTYEPPECDLSQPQSQAYDMWMLGCVFLEFLVWLLEGSSGLREFGERRCHTSLFYGAPFTNDYFYSIIYDESEKGLYAELRPGVRQTIAQLRRISGSSRLLLDLLNIVENDLLSVDQYARATSAELSLKLENLLKREGKAA